MHEARPTTGFAKGKVDPRVAGRKGAQARERRWLDRVNQHREELDKHADSAIEGLGRVVTEEASPTIVPAATAILDRIGLGPGSRQDFMCRALNASLL